MRPDYPFKVFSDKRSSYVLLVYQLTAQAPVVWL